MKSFFSFLNEVSKEDIEKINLERDLHFSNIFGNKLRIVIPLDQNEIINELIRKLEELDYEVDYEDLINKKTVYKKIKTQQGEKVRPEKVGKVLQFYKLTQLLDWWQKNSENLKTSETGASIVISRSPIDILRMSDHDGISSCHSPEGSFYKCAKQEARTGGAIAYVVKNSDLKKVNLQDKEIFEDPERKVQGIVPLERLRLRRLTTDQGKVNLLLPELRTYGIKNIGFLDAVKDWTKKTQENLIKQINPAEDYKSFKLKGGSYQDTDASKIWSNFFNVSVTGVKKSQDVEEEEQEESGDVYERAERTLEEHRTNWKHVDVYLDETEGYLYYSASAEIVILKKLFTSDTIELLDRKNWKETKIVKRVVEDALDISGLEDLEIEQYKYANEDAYSFRFSFRDTDGYYDQLTNFEGFLDYVDDVDKNFQDYINKVYKALLDEGHIKDISEKIEFKNFNLESDDDSFTITTKEPEKVGYLKDAIVEKKDLYLSSNRTKLKTWSKGFANYINQYKVLPIQISPSNIDLYVNQLVQGLSWQQESMKLTGWVSFELNFSLNINLYQNAEYLKRLKNLDNNWDFYIQKLAKLFDKFLDDIGTMKASKLIDAKKLAQKPILKKPQTQFPLGFKEWIK